MTALHIVNRSPARSDALQSCLRMLTPGDALLLIEDAVYAAVDTTHNQTLLASCPDSVSCHALQADREARGLGELLPTIRIVDDDGFVELVRAHAQTISWF